MSTHLPLRGFRERALSDVPPVVHAGPADAGDGGVRLGHRLLDRVAERGHAEHAPAVGHERAVGPLRSGVEDFAALPGAERLHTLDPPPALDRARVALGGEHDAQRGTCIPIDGGAGEAAVARALDQLEQVGAQADEQRLRLRIAEAHVELEHLGVAVPHHEPGVEDARVADALPGEAAHHGLHDLAQDAVLERGRDDGRRRAGAHAARVRPAVAVQGALVVLRGGERQHGRAVRQRHEGDLLALEELLHHDAAARVAEQARGGGRRAEGAEAGGGEAVDQAQGQRQLGADDGEIDVALPGEAQEPLHVVGGDRHALRLLGDAGVAGRAVERADAGALPELPHERVLAPAAADDEDTHQWRKWRTPVKIMATPCASAARMTSWSRVLPPGWMTAVAPAAIASSSPSAKGKKASLARTEPRSEMPSRSARARALRTGSTREVCPPPRASVRSAVVNAMAFDLTCLTTRQAKASARSSSAVGARRVTTLASRGSSMARSASCTRRPAVTPRSAGAFGGAASGCQRTRRRAFFRRRSSSASGSKSGAISTSVKSSSTARARGSVHGRVDTTMPPKGDSGSVA